MPGPPMLPGAAARTAKVTPAVHRAAVTNQLALRAVATGRQALQAAA